MALIKLQRTNVKGMAEAVSIPGPCLPCSSGPCHCLSGIERAPSVSHLSELRSATLPRPFLELLAAEIMMTPMEDVNPSALSGRQVLRTAPHFGWCALGAIS